MKDKGGRDRRRWGEPSDHHAGLTPVKERGKEGGWVGRVSGVRAVLRKICPGHWHIFEPSPSLDDSYGSLEWA